MLSELHIEDLGVISTLDVVFGQGLTVFTGETGAGKTMLVEAISLLVGGRADASVVRSGASEARVEGRFVHRAGEIRGGVGPDADGSDDDVVLARVIPVEGRSRAYVNGRLATVATLAEWGTRLIDIHGQHAHQSLLSAQVQRSSLDEFAGVDLSALRASRGRVAEIDAALASLGGDARSRARELDLLRFQLEEIDAAAIATPEDDVELERLEDELSGAQDHRRAALAASSFVANDLDESGASDRVRSAAAELEHRRPFEVLIGRLHSVTAELDDIVDQLRRLADTIEEDPARLAAVVERRQLLRNLRRKYGDTLAEVLDFRLQARERLDELVGHDAAVDRLEIERAKAIESVSIAASVVGGQRRDAAARLASAVEARLRDLAMPRAQVEVTVGADDPGDDVGFLLAANPGSPRQPLAKVASGGELARTMLALRLVLLAAPSTLVFDEVDAGIGGAAATTVGEALAKLAQRHQVFVVTHLAQVAALADHHLVVTKAVHDNATTATARALDGLARVEEVARMLSGMPDSDAARQHAEELLSSRQVRPASPRDRR